jgi:hypothetical protein
VRRVEKTCSCSRCPILGNDLESQAHALPSDHCKADFGQNVK